MGSKTPPNLLLCKEGETKKAPKRRIHSREGVSMTTRRFSDMRTIPLAAFLLSFLILMVSCSSDSPTDVSMDDSGFDIAGTGSGGSTTVVDGGDVGIDNGIGPVDNPEPAAQTIPENFRGGWIMYSAIGDWEAPNDDFYEGAIEITANGGEYTPTGQPITASFDAGIDRWMLAHADLEETYRIEGRNGAHLNLTRFTFDGHEIKIVATR